MPASVAPTDKRTPTLLTVLFWTGVGLAPLAALILLVADGNGTLRFGAVLAILAVVLIGLSMALRAENGADGTVSEGLREELEQLRRELRAEIVAAAQRGNEALDQARRAEEAAGTVRHRLDAAAAGLAAPPAEERPGGRARVPVVEAYDAGRAQPAGPDEDASSRSAGGRPGADRRVDSPWPARSDATGRHVDGRAERSGSDAYAAEGRARPEPLGTDLDRSADEHAEFGDYPAGPPRPRAERTEFGAYGTSTPAGRDAGRAAGGVYGAARVPEPGARPESRPVGVVHHTETVHVTTRHTIVDGGDAAGSRYGGYAGRWSPSAEERPRGAEPVGQRAAGHREPVGDEPARPGWSGAGQDAWPGAPRSGPEQPWPGASAGGARDGGAWPATRDDGSRDGAAWSGSRADGGREHPWAGVGRAAGGDRGWPARPAEDGWSTGPRPGRSADEPRPWPGSDDDRTGRPSTGEAGWPPAGEAGWPPAGEAGRPSAGDHERAASPEPYGRAAIGEPDGGHWSELRAGNRWAEVRDDGQGREVRVGERRASAHADGGGTGYRVEDRWASVRGTPPGYDSAGPTRHDRGSAYHDGGAPRPDREPSGGGWSGEGQPALPAGGVPTPDAWRPPTQRSGQPEWRQPEPEWQQLTPEWRQPEPEWRRPEPDGYGPTPRDAADRWH
ncbi:hypothetical protein ACH495_09385 [Micromonospora sp. NPDC018662]|uniref:hypothetical protein n=1 Tax=Micromonospora sp. NPDC018662 TaxID=3364238 RepID=UPI0037AA3D01